MNGTTFHPSASSVSVEYCRKEGAAFLVLFDWICRLVSAPPPARAVTSPTTKTGTSSSSRLTVAAEAASNSKLQTRSELRRVFNYLDENGDGKISPTELQRCMRVLGEEMSAEEASMAVLLCCTGTEGGGLLGFDDFVRVVEAEGEEERSRSLREAFRVYAMEGEGCITPSSLSRTLSRLGEERSVDECRLMIRRFDLDGDGVLSFLEFQTMMQSCSSIPPSPPL